jgi:hypothetical protein
MSNIAVLLTTYNRYDDFINILKKIKSKDHNIDVFAYNDCSSQEYVIPELKNCNLYQHGHGIMMHMSRIGLQCMNFWRDTLKKKDLSHQNLILTKMDLAENSPPAVGVT